MHNDTRVTRSTQNKSSLRMASNKKADHIVVTHDVAINARGPTSSLNDMTSLEPNQAAPRGNCSKRPSSFEVSNDEGLNLSCDLNLDGPELLKTYPHVHTGSVETPLVASNENFKIRGIREEPQHKASVRSKHVKQPTMKEDIGCGDKPPVVRGGARPETSIENEQPAKVAVEEDVDCGNKSPVRGGSQLTPQSDEHEAAIGPPKGVKIKEDAGCDDKPRDSSTHFSLAAGLAPSSIPSGAMSGGGGGNEEEVVHMEDAVELLVEHLVRPVLPRRHGEDDRNMTPEKQRAVAQQVHTAIILYNYYHRKRCPKLAFADAKRFLMCASVSVGKDLLPYSSIVHACEDNSGNNGSLPVTDREAIQACQIAAELNAMKDYPDMGVWPIGKVAVLLLDPTKKKCLIEYGADTKGVWSFIEKEYDAAAGISHSTNQPAGQESTNKTSFGALEGPLVLQELAISEVQCRTGMDVSDLVVLDEDLSYSLSKGRTTAKLFIVEYKKTTKGKLVEISIEELIHSMSGPVFVNDPFPQTTTVVEYYHILPYKDILQGLLHRKWTAIPQNGLHSASHEKLEEQDENSMSKMQKKTAKVSTPKQNKRAIKATGSNSNQNSSISKPKKSGKRKSEASRVTAAEALDGESPITENKPKKSCKRKAEASRTTAAEGPDGESPIIGNESLIVPDVKTSGLVTKSINITGTTIVSGGPILLQSGGQVDKNKTQNDNMPQDVFHPMAPNVDHAIENGALERQNMEMTGNSGGITENNNDQILLLQSGGQVDKNKTQNDNVPQDVFTPMAPNVDHAIENGALERQNREMTGNSGGITENNYDQMYGSLRSIQKIRDEILREEYILQERSIQCDMDIQTILNEGKMTSKALSIVDKYKGTCSSMTGVANSACSGDGGQSMSSKRMRLKEALQVRNKCQELDEVCNKCEWVLPRYAILPSVADGMYRASVHFTCPDFDMTIAGDPCPTPREARCSAAAIMIAELKKKAKEEP